MGDNTRLSLLAINFDMIFYTALHKGIGLKYSKFLALSFLGTIAKKLEFNAP
jgi:hypothetical protein